MLFCEMYYRTIEDICFYLLAFGGGISAIVVAVTTVIHAVVSHRGAETFTSAPDGASVHHLNRTHLP